MTMEICEATSWKVKDSNVKHVDALSGTLNLSIYIYIYRCHFQDMGEYQTARVLFFKGTHIFPVKCELLQGIHSSFWCLKMKCNQIFGPPPSISMGFLLCVLMCMEIGRFVATRGLQQKKRLVHVVPWNLIQIFRKYSGIAKTCLN